MKFALITFVTLVLFACSPSAPTGPRAVPPVSPQAPPPQAPASRAWLWGMVVDEGGACIAGATVQVVAGQAVGQSLTQMTPCDAWAYDGGVVFQDLTPGVEMTLRASASGYAAQEKRVIPSLGGQMAILFTPARTK